MNVVMFGPCYGHNIEPFLEFFQNRKTYKLSLVFIGSDFFSKSKKFNRINFSKLNFNPVNILKSIFIIKEKPDLIWFHASSIYVLLLFLLFRKKKSLFVVNIWSEKIPRLIMENSFKGRLWKFALGKADYIQCNWYGTGELLKKSMEGREIVVHPWGLHNDYFKTEYDDLSDIALNFVKKLPEDKVKFYYPKSITFASDHIAIVDAVDLLVKKSITNFVVYFWMGNIIDEKKEKVLVDKIEKLGLTDYIKIEKHNYISYNDIKFIWSKVDVGLQIAIFDQLSTTLLEPMLVGKEVIATNIEPYRKLNSLYDNSKLKLIERDSRVLSEEMFFFIQGNRTEKTLIENRKEMVKTNFCFDTNIDDILSFYKKKRIN
jgi:hypothetical protein